MNNFSFTLLHQDKTTKARLGEIHTPHGIIETPAFVPVGTQATVKSLIPEELHDLGVHLFFVNTYHAYLRPGIEVIQKFGGLHRFMHWDRPIITDSGGFQVFSLGRRKLVGGYSSRERGIMRESRSNPNTSIVLDSPSTIRDRSNNNAAEVAPMLVKIDEDGVTFTSHWDGSHHRFTPEVSMEIQWILGSDIHIAFDECTPYPTTHEYARQAMDRTHRWAMRSKSANEQLAMNNVQLGKPYQALYGVVQGSIFEDLRQESAKTIAAMDFDGIAIGGVSVGESKKEMEKVLHWTVPFLPDTKPRHLLGVGEIDDIFVAVENGMDTFDCVQPTRLARMGQVFNEKCKMYNAEWKIDITKKEFTEDMKPIDESCACYTCRNFSRAYLHHLFRVRELLAYRLATIHNIYFVNQLVKQIRQSIKEGTFLELKKQWLYNKL